MEEVGRSHSCRICYDMKGSLIIVCKCSGTIQFVHQECLKLWLESSKLEHCQICNFKYLIEKFRPGFKKVLIELLKDGICSFNFKIRSYLAHLVFFVKTIVAPMGLLQILNFQVERNLSNVIIISISDFFDLERRALEIPGQRIINFVLDLVIGNASIFLLSYSVSTMLDVYVLLESRYNHFNIDEIYDHDVIVKRHQNIRNFLRNSVLDNNQSTSSTHLRKFDLSKIDFIENAGHFLQADLLNGLKLQEPLHFAKKFYVQDDEYLNSLFFAINLVFFMIYMIIYLAYYVIESESVICSLDQFLKMTKAMTGLSFCTDVKTIYMSFAEVWHPLIGYLSACTFVFAHLLIFAPAYMMRHRWGGPLIIIIEGLKFILILFPFIVLVFPIFLSVFFNWIIRQTFTDWEKLNSFLHYSDDPFVVYVRHWIIGMAILPVPAFFMLMRFFSDPRYHTPNVSFICCFIARLLVYLKQSFIFLIFLRLLKACLISVLIVFSLTMPLVFIYKLLPLQANANIVGKSILALIQQSSSFGSMAGILFVMITIYTLYKHLKADIELASGIIFKTKKEFINDFYLDGFRRIDESESSYKVYELVAKWELFCFQKLYCLRNVIKYDDFLELKVWFALLFILIDVCLIPRIIGHVCVLREPRGNYLDHWCFGLLIYQVIRRIFSHVRFAKLSTSTATYFPKSLFLSATVALLDATIKSVLIAQTIGPFFNSEDHKPHLYGFLFDALVCFIISKFLSWVLFTQRIIRIDYYNDLESCLRNGLVFYLKTLLLPYLVSLIMLTVPKLIILFAHEKNVVTLETSNLLHKWSFPLTLGFFILKPTLFLVKKLFVFCQSSIEIKLSRTEILIRELKRF